MQGTRMLITGCSSGIGRLAAIESARRGADVLACVRSERARDDLIARAGAERVALRTCLLDVTDRSAITRAVQGAHDAMGGIDVLVNNAGVHLFSPVEDTPDDLTEWVFAANFFGAVHLIQAVLPGMRAQRSGVIINVGSSASIFNNPFTGMYGASKAALASLSESLAAEVDTYGIRVVVIQPSNFDTDVLVKGRVHRESAGWPGAAAGMEAVRESMPDAIDDPMEVAEAVIRAVENPSTPFRVPVGRDAVRRSQRLAEKGHDHILAKMKAASTAVFRAPQL
jgi:NAD(P)-dependent dehydrogenase (short-subunit alcohol dehydrogenase family)